MRGVVLVVVLVVAGCLPDGATQCANGMLCPIDRVCSPQGTCVLPEQFAQCNGKPEGSTCMLPSGGGGACFDGVCLPIGCGNGVVEPGEVCDDGNTLSGDGCSKRCDSTETCGNGFIDVDLAEECDCGDASVPDAQRPPGCRGPNDDGQNTSCRADCTLPRCGDGVRDGLEDCDGADTPSSCTMLGYYGGTLGCLPSCHFDFSGCTGHCGDGVRNGPTSSQIEVCDGSDLGGRDCTDLGFYKPDGLACYAGCLLDTTGCSEICGDHRVNGPETCDGSPPAQLSCVGDGYDAGQLGCAAGCYSSQDHCRDVDIQPVFAGVGQPGLRAVWGIEKEFFACGLYSCVHSQGGAWSVMPGSPTGIYDLWGTAPNDVIAVGDPGISAPWNVFHYDGAAWTRMTLPGTATNVFGIWATGTTYFAVGEMGVMKYDGVSWQPFTPAFPKTAVALRDIWGTGPNDFFVVGSNGARFHWDGTTWIDQSSTDTTELLVRVFGRSNTDVTAVTDGGRVHHYDGTTWTTTPVANRMSDVAVMPGGPTIVTGAAGAQADVYMQIGGAWRALPAQSTSSLMAAFGTREKFVGVGFGGAIEWSGLSWLPGAASSIPLKHSLWTSTVGDSYLVGGNDNTGEGYIDYGGQYVWQRFNAGTNTNGTSGFLWSVWANDPTRVVAVGDNGRAFHGSTVNFASKNTGTNVSLLGVWGSGTVFYAVGAQGTVIRFSNNSWQGETKVTNATLRGVWGAGTEVFAVGSGGTILRRSGTTWSVMASGTTNNLLAIWGRSAQDIYVVGDAGTILHFDGTSWSPMGSGTTRNFLAVAGNSWTVFASSATEVYQLIGGRWLRFGLRTAVSTANLLASGTDVVGFMSNGLDYLVGRFLIPQSSETVCTDLWDDDEDGLTDCADPDCAASPACAGTGGCEPITDVTCGDTITGTTGGGATRYPYYGVGCSPRDESGPEAFYRVRRATAGPIQLTLTGFTGDLDLIVSGRSAQGACIADEQCIASSQTAASGGGESTSFAAAAATDYVVIVDGPAGAAGTFSLQVSCP